MRIYLFLLLTSALLLSALSLQAQKLSTSQDSLSYSIGVVVAQNLKKEGMRNVDSELMALAIYDVLNDGELGIDFEKSDSIFRKHIQEVKSKMKEENKLAGANFLAENGKKEGVVSTASGLQYEVLVEGIGEQPTIDSKVRVHYHGTLLDGRVFDSSVDRNEPISFPLRNVIKAWQEAVPLMKVGGKNRVYCPYDLAYGERAAGPMIKPYSTLIFDIELLGIE